MNAYNHFQKIKIDQTGLEDYHKLRYQRHGQLANITYENSPH